VLCNLRAEPVRDAYHHTPLLPTPRAYIRTVTKEPAFRGQDQDGQVRHSTQNQTVRDQRVKDQVRWQRKSRIIMQQLDSQYNVIIHTVKRKNKSLSNGIYK